MIVSSEEREKNEIRDVLGIERDAVLIGNPDAPYLEYEYKVTEKKYNPNYGDDRI